MHVSYQSHQITFVALHRCLHSRSSRCCHKILILLCCHLLTSLQMLLYHHGLTRDTCQTRSTYYQLMHLVYTYRHDYITFHYIFAFIRYFMNYYFQIKVYLEETKRLFLNVELPFEVPI